MLINLFIPSSYSNLFQTIEFPKQALLFSFSFRNNQLSLYITHWELPHADTFFNPDAKHSWCF